ncbi:holo-ACP synthase [Victivallis sp. Marseille-Q1083]|uniref:holo-ACP synthase n=1 Tax=Victivallis sp. Marseille-Q1083 TaxID=2717288 RepID=UPI00158D0126|nr:holo-ACP synthase [Victivallis sp. Marseille-Q1083]
MIIGLGTDIVEIERVRKLLNGSIGEAFLERVYSAGELAAGRERGSGGYEYYAGRWAAKEALSKALGCGIGENCHWQDIEIGNDAIGRPLVTLGGAAAETLYRLHPNATVHLSISHERRYATAMVIIEAN